MLKIRDFKVESRRFCLVVRGNIGLWRRGGTIYIYIYIYVYYAHVHGDVYSINTYMYMYTYANFIIRVFKGSTWLSYAKGPKEALNASTGSYRVGPRDGRLRAALRWFGWEPGRTCVNTCYIYTHIYVYLYMS